MFASTNPNTRFASSREAPKEKPERDPDRNPSAILRDIALKISEYLKLTVGLSIDYGDRMPRFEGINMAEDPAERDTDTGN
ncbi:hypothetical protein IFR05_004736 [Cadophora sp. M221]|nr:hypothetical protein IFR05_004736 [Cadophora sp. M221]